MILVNSQGNINILLRVSMTSQNLDVITIGICPNRNHSSSSRKVHTFKCEIPVPYGMSDFSILVDYNGSDHTASGCLSVYWIGDTTPTFVYFKDGRIEGLHNENFKAYILQKTLSYCLSDKAIQYCSKLVLTEVPMASKTKIVPEIRTIDDVKALDMYDCTDNYYLAYNIVVSKALESRLKTRLYEAAVTDLGVILFFIVEESRIEDFERRLTELNQKHMTEKLATIAIKQSL